MLAGSRSRVAATARHQATDTKVRGCLCAALRHPTQRNYLLLPENVRPPPPRHPSSSSPPAASERTRHLLQLAEPTLTLRRFSSLPLRRRENISPRKQAFEIDEWLRQLRLSVQNAKQRVEEQVRNYLVPIRLHPPSSHAPSSVPYSYSRLFSHSHSQRSAPSASIMRLYQHRFLSSCFCAFVLCCVVADVDN